ncbi:MAG: tRNA (N(6)-L-threonylcarbamoyladenosine(37)-C(2))-methylthiotransferase MtaB [SAR324 cluster bacterium]|nr:tRNA (N(6)-L-threonylcarbamoyladenosine(37)-C(2))-methylthiotransferase MtaB [SAR324 cluster bacterium]
MAEKPRVSFHTLGCRLNQAETSSIAKSFREHQYQLVSENETADVSVINTCTVTEHSDAKNRQLIRALHRKNPAACIAVIGCYSQMAAESIQKLEGVKLVMGNAEKLELVNHIERARKSDTPLLINPKISRKTFSEPVFPWKNLTTRSYLKIQDGCDFMCTFCIIPFSRGRGRAREFENILKEAKSFVEAGSKEIVLTGVNIGTFADRSYSLLTVLDALNELPNLVRLRISSIEPTTISEGVIARMADPDHKLVPFLHLPLQSGSNRILSQMKRRYTNEAYAEEVRQACQQVPDLCVGTDVMVGFPGESEEDFEETYRLLNSLPFSYFHVFPFSERKGTPANRMEQKIRPEEKKRRGALLRALSQQKRSKFYQEFIGKVRPVLFESPNESGDFTGYTDNFIKVSLSTSSTQDLKNQILPVHFLETRDETVLGELVSSHSERI